jgi:hypothetical protein
VVVNRARDQFFARPGLTEQQHRAVGRRHGLDGFQDLPQRRAVADDLLEFMAKLQFEILLCVGELCIQRRDPLVGTGVLGGDRDVCRGLPELRDDTLGECIRPGTAHKQRSQFAVVRHQRYAAHRLDAGRLHDRGAVPSEPFQLGPPEHTGNASLKRHARGRLVGRNDGAGSREATGLVVDQIQAELASFLIEECDADVIGS